MKRRKVEVHFEGKVLSRMEAAYNAWVERYFASIPSPPTFTDFVELCAQSCAESVFDELEVIIYEN